MKRAIRALFWICVAAIVSVAACADEPLVAFLWEDFETLCDGTPCGWERIGGEPDQATWVETIHAGEHGLRLNGEVAVRGAGSVARDEPASGDAMAVTVSAICDVGSSIEIDVVLADELGGAHVGTASPFITSDWIDLGPTQLVFDGAPPSFVTRVSTIAIRKLGSGTCVVSDLVIEENAIVPGC